MKSNDSISFNIPQPKDMKVSYTQTDEDHQWKCPICMDDLKYPVVTPCGHMFCWTCLQHWFTREKSCPFCHNHVDPKTIVSVFGQGTEDQLNEPIPRPPQPEYEELPQPENIIDINLQYINIAFAPFTTIGQLFQLDKGPRIVFGIVFLLFVITVFI